MHIDVHAHFFNARYIPLSGVARSRGAPRFLARFLAWVLIGLTSDDRSLETRGSWFRRTGTHRGLAVASSGGAGEAGSDPAAAIGWFADNVPEEAFASECFREVREEAARLRAERVVCAPLETLGAAAARDWLRGYLKDVHASGERVLLEAEHAEGAAAGIGGFLAFVRHLLGSEKALAEELRDSSPGVSLFVHLMMDMDHPYGDTSHYSYPHAIRRIRELCRQSGGCIVAFVAFDPYRPECNEVVEDVLQDDVFIGIKFYPPSGYRPDRNEEARRAPGRSVSASELDRRCRRLFSFCNSRQIPIMTHCTPGGMQVSPSAMTGWNSNPDHWRETLDRFPDLRLCFGHAGGSGRWFDERAAEATDPPGYPWADAVVDLCSRYENVYTDFGHAIEMLDAGRASRFANELAAAIRRGGEFAFHKKVMYGSDFPMPMPSGGWRKYYAAFLNAIRSNVELREHEEAIFSQNAADYLRPDLFLSRAASGLSDEERRMIQRFVG